MRVDLLCVGGGSDPFMGSERGEGKCFDFWGAQLKAQRKPCINHSLSVSGVSINLLPSESVLKCPVPLVAT